MQQVDEESLGTRTLVLVDARAVEAALEDFDGVQDETGTDFGQREVRRAFLLGELLGLRFRDGFRGRGRSSRDGVCGRSIEDLYKTSQCVSAAPRLETRGERLTW